MEDRENSKQGRKTYRVHLSAGIERAVYLAATDRAFRDALLKDRTAAVAERGIKLSDSELGVLRATPEAQLQAAIDGVDVSEDNLRRRSFLRAVAVSAAALSVGQPLGKCAREARAESKPPPVDIGVPKDVAGYMPDMGSRPPDGIQDIPLITTDGGGPDMGVRPGDLPPADIPQDVPGYVPDAGVRPPDKAVDQQRVDAKVDPGEDDSGGCNMAP